MESKFYCLSRTVLNKSDSNQCCKLTKEAVTPVLKAWDVRLSMGGKGRFKDNIFIERLQLNIEYQRIHLKYYETGNKLSQDLMALFNFHNSKRKHSTLDIQTPHETY